MSKDPLDDTEKSFVTVDNPTLTVVDGCIRHAIVSQMRPDSTCDNCRFKHIRCGHQQGYSECHRHSPVVQPFEWKSDYGMQQSERTVFPSAHQVCGDWEPKFEEAKQ